MWFLPPSASVPFPTLRSVGRSRRQHCSAVGRPGNHPRRWRAANTHDGGEGLAGSGVVLAPALAGARDWWGEGERGEEGTIDVAFRQRDRIWAEMGEKKAGSISLSTGRGPTYLSLPNPPSSPQSSSSSGPKIPHIPHTTFIAELCFLMMAQGTIDSTRWIFRHGMIKLFAVDVLHPNHANVKHDTKLDCKDSWSVVATSVLSLADLCGPLASVGMAAAKGTSWSTMKEEGGWKRSGEKEVGVVRARRVTFAIS